MGDFNAIAQLCSCLFLLTYASVNMACLGLRLASAPNFRPSFKYFSNLTCFLGAAGCSVMMFIIQPLYASVAILLCLSIVLALNLFSPIRDENWGSISQALLFHQVRKYLLMLDPRKAHVKFIDQADDDTSKVEDEDEHHHATTSGPKKAGGVGEIFETWSEIWCRGQS